MEWLLVRAPSSGHRCIRDRPTAFLGGLREQKSKEAAYRVYYPPVFEITYER